MVVLVVASVKRVKMGWNGGVDEDGGRSASSLGGLGGLLSSLGLAMVAGRGV